MHLLIAFLLVQNIAISGTLKDADGKSLAGVRVGAMPVGETFLYEMTNADKDGSMAKISVPARIRRPMSLIKVLDARGS
jgi:hypothetical protein